MFKIVIAETKIEKRLAGKEWVLVGESEYGYSPEIEKHVEVERTVLMQEVETLDLAKVIKAINNL